MKKLVVLIVMIIPLWTFAQDNDLSSSSFTSLQTDFDLSLGSSFMSIGSGSAFMSYAFPKMRITPNEKFSFQAGVLIMNTHLNNVQMLGTPSEPGVHQASTNFTDTYAYVSGDYQVNERFKVTGSAFKKFSSHNDFNQDIHPQAFNFDSYGMNMGFEYKISENAEINANFSYQKGYDPLNPYQRYQNFSSPFGGYSPFSPINF